MSARILVVEDEPGINELLAVNLKRAGYEVSCVASAEEAERDIRAALPDLVILDWMLPGVSGINLARRLRTEERTRILPIIMLTARSEEQDKILGLDTGADDYVTKPFSPRELLARVKALLRRQSPQSADDPVECAGLRIDPVTRRVTAHGKLLEIGPTEFRLLHFLMTHQERVFSRSQILDKVWGDHVFVAERTVDVHIRHLRSSLDAAGFSELIQTVRSVGYRFSSGVPAA